MNRTHTIEEIAAICGRLAKLTQAHREAIDGDDIDFVLRVQAESAKLHKAVEDLRRLNMKKPPGTTGRSVRVKACSDAGWRRAAGPLTNRRQRRGASPI